MKAISDNTAAHKNSQKNPQSNTYYAGEKITFLTRHNKLPLILPPLESLEIELVLNEDYDTDSLGTFTGERPRKLSPRECALQKAKLAAEYGNTRLGIGSEGSFGGGPFPGLMNWDEEILVLFDTNTGQKIVATASGPVTISNITIASLNELKDALNNHDESQGWILKTDDNIQKGLVGYKSIVEALGAEKLMLKENLLEPVELIPDLRAMYCPERQEYIKSAAIQLANRMNSFCPKCNKPDFWAKDFERGLPCNLCGQATKEVKMYIKRCDCCFYMEKAPAENKTADPGRCDYCNP